MATIQLSTYKTWTRTKLNRSSYDSAKLLQFANEANREICNYAPWPFMEGTQNYTAVTGNTSIGTMPTDYQAALSLRVTSPNAYARRLDYVDYLIYDTRYPQPSLYGNATPDIWTIYAGQILLGPAAPDQDYTLVLRYLKTPLTMSADTDVPNVPDDFSELLVLGMYRRALEASDNFNQAQVVMQEWQSHLDLLATRLGLRQFGQPTQMSTGRQRSLDDPWA